MGHLAATHVLLGKWVAVERHGVQHARRMGLCDVHCEGRRLACTGLSRGLSIWHIHPPSTCDGFAAVRVRCQQAVLCQCAAPPLPCSPACAPLYACCRLERWFYTDWLQQRQKRRDRLGRSVVAPAAATSTAASTAAGTEQGAGSGAGDTNEVPGATADQAYLQVGSLPGCIVHFQAAARVHLDLRAFAWVTRSFMGTLA